MLMKQTSSLIDCVCAHEKLTSLCAKIEFGGEPLEIYIMMELEMEDSESLLHSILCPI